MSAIMRFHCPHLLCPACLCSLAPSYDAAVGSEETWMGYGLMRQWMLGYCQVCAAIQAARSRQHAATDC